LKNIHPVRSIPTNFYEKPIKQDYRKNKGRKNNSRMSKDILLLTE